MNDKQMVKIEELRMAAIDIKNKRDSIMNAYESTIKKILNQSEECIKEAGQDYNEVTSNFKNLFSSFDASITELTDVLTNKIIPNYEDLIENINNSFNHKFASEMKRILELEDNNEE